MPDSIEPSGLSLLPALVTIVLAFATRQVIVSLFLGIVTGGIVLFIQTGNVADLNIIDRFLFPAIGSKGYAKILLIYLWCLGGLIGIWQKTGAARLFAEQVAKSWVRGPRSALFAGWSLGMVFFQGGTVSTVLTGSTVKPIADRYRVSHEELSYVVDSTSSPIATLLAFNAWPFFVASLVAGTIPLIPDEAGGTAFFFSSIPFNFYAIIAVISTLLLSLGWLPWVGKRMSDARKRARDTGELDDPQSNPIAIVPSEDHGTVGYTASLAEFIVPLVVLVSISVVPYIMDWGDYINEAFLGSVLSAMLVALFRGMRLGDVLGGFVDGCQKMTIGAIVLGLAVTIGTVSKELHTASFLVQAVGNEFPALWLPALLTLLCMIIAFATGTSWGTYAVVFPIAMPLAYALNPDPYFIKVCFGAVLGGAVFGDQCSPISDTTILSSMFTGCDLMDHVRSQMPLALAAAGLGAICSTLAALL